MGYLTWKQSGERHTGYRNGAQMVRLTDYRWSADNPHGPGGKVWSNWDAPIPDGWYGEGYSAPHEWYGPDALDQGKAAQEREFVRWATLMGILPVEAVADPDGHPFPPLAVPSA